MGLGVSCRLLELKPPRSPASRPHPHVRLACQISPHAPITVTRLVDAGTRKGASAGAQGVERTLAVLFLDTRGFTRISEMRLPYDVVFILNRLFAEVGEAIKRHGGVIDKYG